MTKGKRMILEKGGGRDQTETAPNGETSLKDCSSHGEKMGPTNTQRLRYREAATPFKTMS